MVAIKYHDQATVVPTVLGAKFELGVSLLEQENQATLMANATAMLSSMLGVTHTMILHRLPNADALLLRAGTGWKPGMIGHALFDADPTSLAHYVLSSSEAVVVVDNLRMESRFSIPPPLQGHGLISGICSKIVRHGQTLGIIAAFDVKPRSFSQDDRACLCMFAGILAGSNFVEHRRIADSPRNDQEKITQAKQEWEVTVDALPQFICLLDDQKRIVRANRSVEKWFPGHLQDVRGFKVHELLHPGCIDPSCYMESCCDQAWVEVMNAQNVNFDVEDKVLGRYLNIQLRPINLSPESKAKKSASRVVVVLQDITRVKHAEELLKNNNDQLEHRIQARTAELLQANQQLKREVDERRRMEEELRHSENEMRLMSAQLLTAQEVERKRIASELHDGIGQSLSAIKFYIENTIGLWAAHGADRERAMLESIVPKIQNTIEEVRKISMDLRPSTLDDLGILATIAWFCREFRSIYNGIHLETHVDLAEKDVSIPLKTVIFRILQEALNNIVKHARASHVSVHLRKIDCAIELVIHDNGRGFDVETVALRKDSGRGFGITGMKERSEFSGGSFTIRSTNETGTVIQIFWPCQS